MGEDSVRERCPTHDGKGARMVDVSTVTNYFSEVLKLGTLDKVMFEQDSAFVRAPREQLSAGVLPQDHTDALFEAHDRKAGRKPRGAKGRSTPQGLAGGPNKDDGDSSIPVVLSLASLAGGRGHAGLAMIEATLYRDGRLVPVIEVGRSPWIPAERLEAPAVTSLELMVAHLDRFWTYARDEATADASQSHTVADALGFAESMVEKVSGQSIEILAIEAEGRGLHIEHEHVLVQELERISAVGGLLQVYDHLDRAGAPALVQRMVGGWTGPRTHESSIHGGTGLDRAARLSCGSMSDGFPLTPSQRRAVHAYLQGDDGDVTAVSGPPGTGKTTMLQAIVANLVTRRALEKQDAPVIVGTSTNNQAVTNIITSFASVVKDQPGSLDLRWLPQEQDGEALDGTSLRSLAVYCPATSKVTEAAKSFLVEQPNKSHTYTAYTAESYVSQAKDNFVMSAHRYFGEVNDIPGLSGWIHEALTTVDTLRTDLLHLMATEGRSGRYLAHCRDAEELDVLASVPGVADLRGCQDLAALDRTLDVTLRYAEFWLAVHWFEAQWLLAEDDFIAPDERWKNTRDVMETYWRQAAALTPCFVMTAYQVPRYFRLYSKPEAPSRYDLGRIDLLIVDEAGQVDTPIGLPAFAMACRALVVGDVKQLAPVWSIDEETDREIAEGAGIDEATWREDLRRRGLTCSAPSSLMRAAAHASSWVYGEGEPGLFLSEHFRCHPDIIGLCNELLYDGLLEPHLPADGSKLNEITPAFLFHEVPGSQDTKLGSSRCNQVEAAAVAQWIVNNFGYFYDIYHLQEPKLNKRVAQDALIGVVTPFSAQARLIIQELRRAALAPDAPEGLPAQLWKKITVGTAHRLQGAERPIILFSAVYGEGSGSASFIDANLELMNVAVSRAKDLLIVFAARNRWRNGPVFTTMASYAVRSSATFGERFGATEDKVPTGDEAPAMDEVPTGGDGEQPPAGRTVPESTASAPEHDPVTPRPGPGLPSVTISGLLRNWQEAGELRVEDADLMAKDLNLRLKAAGVLHGDVGAWEPTPVARMLGVRTEVRSKADGSEYEVIEYSEQVQELLLEMYLAGEL